MPTVDSYFASNYAACRHAHCRQLLRSPHLPVDADEGVGNGYELQQLRSKGVNHKVRRVMDVTDMY